MVTGPAVHKLTSGRYAGRMLAELARDGEGIGHIAWLAYHAEGVVPEDRRAAQEFLRARPKPPPPARPEKPEKAPARTKRR
jgi:hypothetical protein